MPARLSRSLTSASKPRNARNKNRKRALNALAIASHEHAGEPKVRRGRLGEVEDDGPRRKKARVEDEDEGDDDEEASGSRRAVQKKPAKGRFDELDLSEGSDSDGNKWRYGEVDEEDDESLDSDEAFGESDEERFEGFTFRGSSSNKVGTKKRKPPQTDLLDGREMNLDEGEEDGGSDDDSLGSDAVDLATMLDEELGSDADTGSNMEAEGSSDDENEDAESFGGFLDDEEDVQDDPEQLSRVKDLIASVYHEEAVGATPKARFADSNEFSKPSDFAPIAFNNDANAADWSKLLPAGIDPTIRKAIASDREGRPSKRGKLGKLEAPLPKRQQDKLDRTAASEKAKETLERWVDTVKHNRRAAHLSFPLADPDAPGEPAGTDRLTRHIVPTTDLEKTIQSIMETSVLAVHGEADEDQIRAFEELQTNKLPLEEVQRRRAELRKTRDLLFREEIRAKRIKKIKSKSYRRVHRKDREKLAERERAELRAAGVDVSEDERERNDRRRAEERMGARHRESKWAKGMKASGRVVWDDDAKLAVSDMARRNEELRRRVEGKTVHAEGSDADTDVSSSEEEDVEDEDLVSDNPEKARKRRLQRQLDRVNTAAREEGVGLASLQFMKRAEARRKAQNDEAAALLAREIGDEEGSVSSESEHEVESIGRKLFGPGLSLKPPVVEIAKEPRGDFEELDQSSDEVEPESHSETVTSLQQRERHKLEKSRTSLLQASDHLSSRKPHTGTTKATQPQSSHTLAHSKPTRKEDSIADESGGWTLVTKQNASTYGEINDETGEDEEEMPSPTIRRDGNPNQAIVSAAFGGEDVDASFAAEKAELVVSEGDKVIDNTLPGWGNWVGEGVSKRTQARNKGRFVTFEKGVKRENRKDTRLERVIISQARVKKNAKFLASTLPFPFEERKQYEASLRMPVGIGMTKTTVMGNTKPRVLVKKGAIIQPMEKPSV